MGRKGFKKVFRAVLILQGVFGSYISAQSTEALGFPDSLLNYTYRELRDIFLPMERDSLAAIPYVLAHTYKAKRDTSKMALVWSYRNLGYISNPRVEAMYIDSMLQLTENTSNYEYLSRIYTSVGIYYRLKGDFHNALQYHLRAYEHSIKSKNRVLQARSKYKIAGLKTISGNGDEAIEMCKELIRDFSDSIEFDVYHEKKGFLNVNFKIFECYLAKEELDSASGYLEKAIKKSVLMDSAYYWKFHCYKGVMAYKNGDYASAIDLMSESILHRTGVGLFYNYYYRGSAYLEADSIRMGISDYRKADSIAISNNISYRERLVIFKKIAEYYEEIDSTENELAYIKKYLEMDSIIDLRYAVFKNKIKKTFDAPLMLQKKEVALAKLAAKNKQYKGYWTITGGTLLGVLGLLFHNIHKRRRLKKRFDTLLADTTKVPSATVSRKSKINGMSHEVVEDIRSALLLFEQELGFLSNGLNQNALAKQLNTNPNYLSRVINADKNKNFTAYINDLRVSYAISQLQKDSELRKYSIKAIAQEIGFNNAESFSKAFKKTTGMYPSYFIKQLEKAKESKSVRG